MTDTAKRKYRYHAYLWESSQRIPRRSLHRYRQHVALNPALEHDSSNSEVSTELEISSDDDLDKESKFTEAISATSSSNQLGVVLHVGNSIHALSQPKIDVRHSNDEIVNQTNRSIECEIILNSDAKQYSFTNTSTGIPDDGEICDDQPDNDPPDDDQTDNQPDNDQTDDDDQTDDNQPDNDQTDVDPSDDDSTDDEHLTNVNLPENVDIFSLHHDKEDFLYPGAAITNEQSSLLILGHLLRYQCNKESTGSLLKLIQAHLPHNTCTKFPSSDYLFFKNLSDYQSAVTNHVYCGECDEYVGIESKECPGCGSYVLYDEAVKAGYSFMVFNLEDQISAVLQTTRFEKNFSESRTLRMTDMHSGLAYQRLPKCDLDFTLTWNTDGVKVFNSSGVAIWPIQAIINELDFPTRVQNVLLAALWYGDKKPTMNTFLKPFVNQLNFLSTKGMEWKDSKGTLHHSRIFPGPCSVDSIARCLVMSMRQFNGINGCPWCLEEGEVVVRGRGHARVYTNVDDESSRSHESYISDAKEAVEEDKPIRGIKGPSILLLLLHFNMVTSFVVDYMHSVCLGVVRQMTFLLLDSSSHSERYYIGNKIHLLDKLLLKLKPINEITRTPRSLLTRKYWKAAEWRAWLLYYSPVILEGTLPLKYYQNWMLLVTIMHTLLGSTIFLDELDSIQCMVLHFMKDFQQLYGDCQMTFNVHLLKHLVNSVRNWGPLWSHSAFPFEGMNGKLMKMFHGTQAVPTQIARNFILLKQLSLKGVGVFDEIPSLMEYFSSLVRGYHLLKKISRIDSSHSTFVFGRGEKISLTPGQIFTLQKLGISCTEGFSHKKVKIKGTIFYTKACHSRKLNSRRNNTIALCDTGEIGIVQAVVGICTCILQSSTCTCKKDYYIFLHLLHVMKNSHMTLKTDTFTAKLLQLKRVKATQSLIAKRLESIKDKCLFLECEDKLFIATVANLLERD